MNPERWEQIKQLYHSALEQESGNREDFLNEACAGDESLRSEVESMLAHQAESPDFLESPALHVEAKALAKDQEEDLSRQGQSVSPAANSKHALRGSANSARPSWWLYLLAVVFMADCVLRSYCYFLGPRGFDFTRRQLGGRSVVTTVPPGSAADRAGLKPGDVLLALDGQAILRDSDWRAILSNLETGQAYRFDIERDGLRETATYSMERVNPAKRQIVAIWQIDAILLLATALFIAFARPRDFLARMGALALASLSCSLANWSSFPHGYAAIWRNLPRGPSDLLWIPNVCSWLVGPILLTFFALFPRALFRARWPWAVIWLPALGIKRSEEPYTREDREMLSAIAANLELLLARPEAGPLRLMEQFEECPQCGICYPTGTALCVQESAPLAPVHMPRTLAGRYHMERRLGRGGMGAVYEATDRALTRRVAVKVIREDRLISEEPVRRFQREARAAAAFTHPNVVTVYDYGVEAGARAFLVMELLQGTTLRNELQARKRLSAPRTIQIFRGVCSAVEAAHGLHLIHRDLKPENIFLAGIGDGGGEMVKVLDFGIAKFLPAGEDMPACQTDGETEAGILVGTPGYISPEQLLGETPAVSWDLWALAVTAYETLTGSLPFPAASSGKWRQAVLAGEHAPLHEYLALPPEPWEEFFTRTLASDRAVRPRSAVEFLRQLEQALA